MLKSIRKKKDFIIKICVLFLANRNYRGIETCVTKIGGPMTKIQDSLYLLNQRKRESRGEIRKKCFLGYTLYLWQT